MDTFEQLSAFAKLHAHELQHPDALGLPREQEARFRSLCPVDAGRPNLALRIATGLQQESLEAVGLLDRPGSAPTLLDCGCGWGTHALMFAFLGAKVVAVELIEDRLEIARARLDWYRRQTDRKLDVEFVNRNVFPVLGEHPCEIVWVCQAISHIHPAEGFLQQLYDAMPQGGHVVISDANWLNVPTRIHLYRQFWRVNRNLKWYSHQNYTDPETGEPVEMAEERVFSPGGLARLISGGGFELVGIRTRGFVPMFRLSADGKWGRALAALQGIDRTLSSIPLIGRTGTFLVGVGRKGDAKP